MTTTGTTVTERRSAAAVAGGSARRVWLAVKLALIALAVALLLGAGAWLLARPVCGCRPHPPALSPTPLAVADMIARRTAI